MSTPHSLAAMLAAGLLSWAPAAQGDRGWALLCLGCGAAAWAVERIDATIEANRRRAGIDG